MTRRSAIVTVSLGDFRCRLEGFAEPLAALAAVAPWLATAPEGEDGPGDPPARGAPGGIRRAIRNGALVLTPAGGEADATDPRLRAAKAEDLAPPPAPEEPLAVAPRPAAPEAPSAPALGGAFEAGPDAEANLEANLRLLARVARAAALEDERRAPAPRPAGPEEPPRGAEPHDAPRAHEPARPAPILLPVALRVPFPDDGEDGGAPAEPRAGGDPGAPEEPGEPRGGAASDVAAGDAWAASGAGTEGAMAPSDGSAGAEAGASPVVALRPRRPVLPVAAGGSPRVAGPGAAPSGRASTSSSTLPPLRLMPAQRVEPPVAASPGAPIRPRRPVRRAETGASGR